MSKRNRREHGRIISVETMTRGDALAADVAAGATSITVNDAGDFDEDGGWLYIGAQTIEYTACDDDTGIITLATALTAAGEEGDPVQVWSDLYDEVVDYQQALVELDGEYDNPDPVVAEVAEGVVELPEGDRGRAGESCTLLRVSDDEWEIVGVGGRPRTASGSGAGRWENTDGYTLIADDITAGIARFALSHRPDDEAIDAKWNGLGQEPSEYTVDYDGQTVTWPLDGFEEVGDRLTVHYTYRKGVATSVVIDAPYDPTACSTVHPTTASASLYVYNPTNWESRATINGAWVGASTTTLQFCIVYRDAADAPGTYKFTPDKTLRNTNLNTEIVNGLYGGDKTGAYVYGLQIYGATGGTTLAKTLPQDDPAGTLGTTDPTNCRFWWGDQIAVTGDGSDVPMGPLT